MGYVLNSTQVTQHIDGELIKDAKQSHGGDGTDKRGV